MTESIGGIAIALVGFGFIISMLAQIECDNACDKTLSNHHYIEGELCVGSFGYYLFFLVSLPARGFRKIWHLNLRR